MFSSFQRKKVLQHRGKVGVQADISNCWTHVSLYEGLDGGSGIHYSLKF